MRLIIAGSRSILDKELVFSIIKDQISKLENKYNFKINSIISGGAKGIDTFAEDYSKKYNYNFKLYPAYWDTFGKKAGYIRNVEMAKNADILLAIWDGKSKGTKHMIDIAKKENLIVDLISV
jgi:hypothetical protein